MHFKLNPECYFISGRRRGAVFDLIDNKIYVLNQEENELVMSSEANQPVSGEETLLKEFKKLRLGNFYTNNVYVYKIKETSDDLTNQINIYRAFLEINNSCKRDCWFCGKHGIKRSSGCMGCNKWNEDGAPLGTDRWKMLVDELRDLGCQNIFITGGDLTLAWDRTVEILDHAKDKFANIYIILHQESLSNINLGELDCKVKPIIQAENLSSAVAQEGSRRLLIVNPEHWSEGDVLTGENKNVILDYVTKNRHFTKALPITSKEKAMKADMHQFLYNRRSHACLGNTLAISYTGNVLPCPMMRAHSFGNVGDKELCTIFEKEWSEINKFWTFNLDHIEKCKGCEFRYACTECRALEESMSGKLEGKWGCSYDPENGVWI